MPFQFWGSASASRPAWPHARAPRTVIATLFAILPFFFLSFFLSLTSTGYLVPSFGIRILQPSIFSPLRPNDTQLCNHTSTKVFEFQIFRPRVRSSRCVRIEFDRCLRTKAMLCIAMQMQRPMQPGCESLAYLLANPLMTQTFI